MSIPVTPRRIQLALVERLKSITADNGYPLTVKNVDIARKQIAFTFAASECPYIEVLLTNSRFDRGANGEIRCFETYAMRLVKDAEATDYDMHEFASAVWQCLFCNRYGGQPFASGIGLDDGNGNTIVDMIPESVDSDIGILEENRIWVIAVSLLSIRHVWNL